MGKVAEITWRQALAWRLRRHLLEPVGATSVPGVVRQLGGVQAQVASSAELAIRLRRSRSAAGEVDRALASGRLIKTWAMRGALHLLTPAEGGAFLAILSAGRAWELPSWQSWFEMTPRRWELLREVARDALTDGPLTRQELGAAVAVVPELAHLREHFNSSWGTILHPLAVQGDLSLGPPRGGRATFQRLDANPRWTGLPHLDEAGIQVLETYFRAYGPARIDNIRHWLGPVAKKRIVAWLEALSDRLVEVDVDGDPAHVLREDLAGLAATRATAAVRLLPGFDQWILGPGTRDGHVTTARRRPQVSRQAGWISPVVLAGGVVAGTWSFERDDVNVTWFRESGAAPRATLLAEVDRLASILGREFGLAIRRV